MEHTAIGRGCGRIVKANQPVCVTPVYADMLELCLLFGEEHGSLFYRVDRKKGT